MSRKSSIRWTIVFCAAALAAPLRAQTYKWVDEKGVTNYSNKPPAGAKAKPQLVEDRLSVSSDPELAAAAAAVRAHGALRAQIAEQEWLQRQRLMIVAQAAPYSADSCPYRADCESPFGYAYGYPPVLVVRSARPLQPRLRPAAPARLRMHSNRL